MNKIECVLQGGPCDKDLVKAKTEWRFYTVREKRVRHIYRRISESEFQYLETLDNLVEIHRKNGGGLIAGPQGIGIMIGKKKDIDNTPKGWIFIDVDDKEIDDEQMLRDLASGRSNWPANAKLEEGKKK